MRDKGPFSYIPWGVRHAAGVCSFAYCATMLFFQGTGRHSPDEVKQLRREAITALADYAADAYAETEEGSAEPFWVLGGKNPTEADFTLFGYLSVLLAPELWVVP